METDALIQKTIRAEFKDCTLIAIAHRLHTVIDGDTILVMDKGQAAEYGRPRDLLADANSALSSRPSMHPGAGPLHHSPA